MARTCGVCRDTDGVTERALFVIDVVNGQRFDGAPDYASLLAALTEASPQHA